MSPHVVRCAHCGQGHESTLMTCPTTGRALRSTTPSSETLVPSYVPPPPRKPPPLPPGVRSSAPPQAPQGHAQPQSSIPPAPSVSPNSAHTVARSATRSLIGQLIDGKYLIRGVLGEGGMGTVYEAENRALRRSVAVKVLHPAQARKKVAVKRFQQEARAAGAIGHPNICEVYDLGTLEDGSPYLVMECLQGETLADRIAAEGGLAFDDLCDVVSQVLSGLVAAHEKGIVHRDIKPENVFLIRRSGMDPVAKLLDFGVSKVMPMAGQSGDEEQLNLTRTGMVMGTPYYMSPEQARGDRNLDGRVDIWACGVILYEGLTGRRPFTAANYNALLLQILTTNPRPARELRPALPPAFDAVMNRAMARAREERYQTAGEFQAALKQLRDRRSAPHPIAQHAPQFGPSTAVMKNPGTPGSAGSLANASSPPAPARPDPLASLPKLASSEPRMRPNLHDEESSTHLALDVSHLDESGEEASSPALPIGLPPGAPHEFDDIATEIHRGPLPPISGPVARKLEPTPISMPMSAPSPSTDWDDVTTRLDPRRQLPPIPPPSADKARKPAPKPPMKNPPKPSLTNFEDTVKIEGDLEAHFAAEIEKSRKES